MQIDRDFLLQTLTKLVQIDSVNPSLTAGAAGETAIANYTQETLQQLGLTTTRHEPEPGRPSIVGRLAGTSSGRTLMFNAHYDTVGVEGMAEPFSGAIRDGKLYGRGAYDMKGSLAAQIAAAKALIDAGVELNGDLFIAAVADEEYASIGAQSIIAAYPHIDAVIVTEPSELEISLAHKGFIWLEVVTHGLAYHGSRPDLGIDANMHMGRFLQRLESLSAAVRQQRPHPLLGPPSLHAATLRGGTELSVYAAECRLGIERRTLPGETAETVISQIQPLLAELSAADPEFTAELHTTLVRDPFEVDANAPIVQTLTAVSTDVLGTPPPHIGQMFWTDAAFHAATGSDTVLIGPKGHGLHSAEEWVDVQSVIQLAEILAHTAATYLNQ